MLALSRASMGDTMRRILLLLAWLWALPVQAQVINCPSGFTHSSGACGVALIGEGNAAFKMVGTTNGSTPGLNGSQVLLMQNGANHAAISLMYQTQVDVQAFTATYTFVPNGWNTVFMVQNSSNHPGGGNGP